MRPDSKRWVEVTPSEHAHERGGLAAVRGALPDNDPYRAWSNFTFTATDGRLYEVDLLVIGKSGLHLIELKHWQGRITGDGQTWWHNGSPVDNPRLLADAKAKRLKSVLQDVAREKNLRVKIPYISAAVLLHAPDAKINLDPQGAHGVYGLDSQNVLPKLVADLLTAPPSDSRNAVDHQRSKQLAKLLENAGLRRSVAQRQVGTLLLDEDPIAEGPNWQDYIGRHTSLDGVVRRVRFYLVHKAASRDDRATTQRAARREFGVLEGVQHPGIARAVDFVDHERGPAIVFEHDPNEVRLDRFIEQHNSELSLEARIDIVNTLAATVVYAHRRRLVHRRLSPLSVYVRPSKDGRHVVRIRDWQMSGRISTQGTHVSGTQHIDALADKDAAPYLAPDGLTKPDADGVLLDVFGLGSIAYLVFAGAPPARSGEELLQKLISNGGLDVGADMDGAHDTMVGLVEEATQGDVDLRTPTAAEFAKGVDKLLDDLTSPDEPTPQVDPLDADKDQVIGTAEAPDRFKVLEKLGSGSTAKALLVEDQYADPPRRSVLKVARDPSRHERLVGEAEVLQTIRSQRIAALVEGPIEVGNRTALLIEDAGRETLDELIRREGRLSIDLLERWGTDLIKILEALDLAGINHRDIKPANLAHRELNQKTRQQHLVLFDFSLSRAPLAETNLGTPRYLDPFFHPVHRPRWDAAAERYAAAVTLYEMATGTLPSYGGEANPAVVEDDVTIDPDLFEPDIADELAAFFATALARDPNERHDSVEAMAREWTAIFARVPKAEAEEAEPLNLSERDTLAAAATLETPLHESGLTPRAVSALTRSGVATVGDLIERPQYEIVKLAGGSDATRREVRRRAKRWRQRLGRRDGEVLAAVTGLEQAPEGSSVDAVLQALVPAENSRNETKVAAIRVLLGLPRRDGEQTLSWPSHKQVAGQLGVTAGRIAQIASAERTRWSKITALTEVRDQIVELVEQHDGVASADEVALRILGVRGSALAGHARLHVGIGLVRAAVEVELERGGDARLDMRRVHSTVLLAREPVDPDATGASARLDYAVELGKRADELAKEEPLPSAARTAESLGEVRKPDDLEPLAAERLPRLAVAASTDAALTSRGEIYPVGLTPERALAAISGIFTGVRQPITSDQLKSRVRTRYPQAAPLPDRPELDALVEDADLAIRPSNGEYVPKTAQTFTGISGTTTRLGSQTGADSPERDHAIEEKLRAALARRGFLTLTVNRSHLDTAAQALCDTFGLTPFNVTVELMAEVHKVVEQHKIPWSTILNADRPDASARDKGNLIRIMAMAAEAVEERIENDPDPLLLTDAEPLARYGRLARLETLADPATNRPAARWLLVAEPGPGNLPKLDEYPAPTVGGWHALPRSWIDRIRTEASSPRSTA